MHALQVGALVGTVLALAACGGTGAEGAVKEAAAAQPTGTPYVVRDSLISATLDATAVAEPVAQATVSTKLMGTVTAVLVKEGDRVAAGAPMVRIDARDLDAKRLQVQAGITSAEAMEREAELMATRMRALYADSAAPKAHLDQAKAEFARAQAGVSAARAGAGELDAIARVSRWCAPHVQAWSRSDSWILAPGIARSPIDDAWKTTHRCASVTTMPPRPCGIVVSRAGAKSRSPSRACTRRPGSKGSCRRRREASIRSTPSPAIAAVRSSSGAVGALFLTVGQGRAPRSWFPPPPCGTRKVTMTGVLVTSGGATTTRWIRVGATAGTVTEVLAGLRPRRYGGGSVSGVGRK